MNMARGLVACAALAAAACLAWSWFGPRPSAAPAPAAPDQAAGPAEHRAALQTAHGHAPASPGSYPSAASTPAAPDGSPSAAGVTDAAAAGTDAGAVWPVPAQQPTAATATAAGEPEVPTRLAFRALWYLGVDPEAETTWSRAINDLRHPAGVRSDLIVDMVDEGYTDNSHPTQADLQLILTRLEIIERHAPSAIDAVNAKAFERAYEQLLAMYIRLSGEARKKG